MMIMHNRHVCASVVPLLLAIVSHGFGPMHPAFKVDGHHPVAHAAVRAPKTTPIHTPEPCDMLSNLTIIWD